MKYLLIGCFFLSIQVIGFDSKRQEAIDSLKSLVSSNEPDTARIKAYHFLAHYYAMLDSSWASDSSIYFIDQSIGLMNEIQRPDFSSYPYVRKFQLLEDRQEYNKALEEMLNYLEIAQTHHKTNWEADALSEVMGVFDFLKDTVRSEEYAQKLITLVGEMSSKKLQADCYNSLGTHYKEVNDLDKALKYHQLSLAIRLELNDKKGASYSFNNIGIVYKNKKEYKEALNYYFKSLKIKEELNDVRGMAGSNINIAKVHLLANEFDRGIPYVKRGIELTKESKALDFQLVGYEVLYSLEKGKGSYKNALEALEKSLELGKIVHDKEIAKQTKELERKYEANKRLQEVKILQQKQEIKDLELTRQEEDLNQQRKIILFFIIGAFIVSVLLIFLIINRNQKARMNMALQERNKEIQKQKEETELQKSIVEQKNREITDSIAYAKKIQSAILPASSKVDQLLQNKFILYMPKDIVAGDFYWIEEMNGITYVAAADCTGHGVPGALVSVVCSNMLSKALLEEKILKPNKILDRTRELVIDYFERGEESVKDGMDIALIAIYREKEIITKIEFSGANNPLLMIEKGVEEQKIIEIKGDKQPIGKTLNEEPFSLHEIRPKPNTMIYLFTDGFQDQFGGEYKGGKKLKSKNFYKLLHSYHQFHVTEQPKKLREALDKWQGDLEQVDDICVIGIKV